MIRTRRTQTDMHKLTETLRKPIRWLPLFTLLTIWISSSGCGTVKVISADQQETFAPAGVTVTPAVDSVLMPEPRYQRYRRAVADAIQVENLKTNK